MHSKKPQFWGILGLPPYYDCMSKYRRSSALCYSWLRESYRKEVFFVRKRAVHICLQKSRFRAHFVFMLKIVFCRIFYLNSSPVAEEGWSMIVKKQCFKALRTSRCTFEGRQWPVATSRRIRITQQWGEASSQRVRISDSWATRPRAALESPNNRFYQIFYMYSFPVLGEVPEGEWGQYGVKIRNMRESA